MHCANLNCIDCAKLSTCSSQDKIERRDISCILYLISYLVYIHCTTVGVVFTYIMFFCTTTMSSTSLHAILMTWIHRKWLFTRMLKQQLSLTRLLTSYASCHESLHYLTSKTRSALWNY